MRPDLIARIGATDKPYTIFTDYVEDTALIQFAECMEQPSVVKGALMADTHAGYIAPIGSVLLTKDTIFPSFVGYDIGCGMSECKLDLDISTISKEDLETIKTEILKRVPIGFKRHNRRHPLTRKLRDMPMTEFAKTVLKETGPYQLGTLGGGNHFLEIGSTDDGKLSIVIHSGSRGVGHKIATHHMKEAAIDNTDESRYALEFDAKNKKWYEAVTSTFKENDYLKAKKEFIYRRVRARVENIEDGYPLNTTAQRGINYINDMNMALQFALDNRKLMIQNVIKAISTVTNIKYEELRFINRNHNHADLTSEGWLHRKGATHAEEGMYGVIPGNMVDGSFIVQGKGNEDSMNSSSHGAGRVLSRRKAKEQLNLEEFKSTTSHLVANHSDSNLDESPKAYKNIFEVMDNQKELVTVIDRVVPVLNIKG